MIRCRTCGWETESQTLMNRHQLGEHPDPDKIVIARFLSIVKSGRNLMVHSDGFVVTVQAADIEDFKAAVEKLFPKGE